MNWVANTPPPANAPNDDIQIDLPISKIGGAQTTLDIANLKTRSITFVNSSDNTNSSVRISSATNSITFDNAGKFIGLDNDKTHTIDVPVALANTGPLEFKGTGSASGRVTISKVVSGTPGIKLNHTGFGGGGALYLTGKNTFQGGVDLTSGLLGIGNDDALGTGPLTINGGAIASVNGKFAPANPYTMNGGFLTVARGGTTDKLTLSGPGTFVGLHQITLDSPAEVLELSGAVTAPNAALLRFNSKLATQAPTFRANPKKGESPIAETRAAAVISGKSPNFQASIEAYGVTLKVSDTLGANGTEMNGVTFGDPTPAPPIGQPDPRVRTAVIARKGSFFVKNDRLLSVVGGKRTIWDQGDKIVTGSRTSAGTEVSVPGVTTIAGGGGFSMEAETGFSMLMSGLSPGNDAGQYSQLVMNDGGAVTLQHDVVNGTRPILYPVVAEDYTPNVGDQYKLIDQTASFAPRLDASDNLFQIDPANAAILSAGLPGDPTLYDGTVFQNGDGMVWRMRYGLTPGVDPGATSSDMNDVYLQVVAVPEPFGLGAAGVVAAAGLLRRRRHRTRA